MARVSAVLLLLGKLCLADIPCGLKGCCQGSGSCCPNPIDPFDTNICCTGALAGSCCTGTAATTGKVYHTCCTAAFPNCCGNNDEGCCPAASAVCCGKSNPGKCCQSDHPICCSDGCCTADHPTCCPNGCCPGGMGCCGTTGCNPGGTVCCPSTGGYCPGGTHCCDNDTHCCRADGSVLHMALMAEKKAKKSNGTRTLPVPAADSSVPSVAAADSSTSPSRLHVTPLELASTGHSPVGPTCPPFPPPPPATCGVPLTYPAWRTAAKQDHRPSTQSAAQAAVVSARTANAAAQHSAAEPWVRAQLAAIVPTLANLPCKGASVDQLLEILTWEVCACGSNRRLHLA